MWTYIATCNPMRVIQTMIVIQTRLFIAVSMSVLSITGVLTTEQHKLSLIRFFFGFIQYPFGLKYSSFCHIYKTGSRF